MMGMQTAPAQLFYDFCLDDHVPEDHLLRRIDRFLDLEKVRAELKPFYSNIRQRRPFPRRSAFNSQGECLAIVAQINACRRGQSRALPRFETTCLNLGIGIIGSKAGPNRPVGFTTQLSGALFGAAEQTARNLFREYLRCLPRGKIARATS
jgi:hypothetical protein